MKKQAEKVETTKGAIKAISISSRRGTKKSGIHCADLRVDCGIIGDAHAGNWHRQISLLAVESIDKMVAMGAKVAPGDRNCTRRVGCWNTSRISGGSSAKAHDLW